MDPPHPFANFTTWHCPIERNELVQRVEEAPGLQARNVETKGCGARCNAHNRASGKAGMRRYTTRVRALVGASSSTHALVHPPTYLQNSALLLLAAAASWRWSAAAHPCMGQQPLPRANCRGPPAAVQLPMYQPAMRTWQQRAPPVVSLKAALPLCSICG